MQSTSTISAARKKLIVALDVSTLDEARQLAEQLSEHVGVFKVGLELYARYGTGVFDAMEQYNHPLFFDCKFLDIPNTVARASKQLVGRRIEMFNVHATGGATMLKTTVTSVREEAASKGIPAPKIIAVTILTSLDDSALANELGWPTSARDAVVRLAKLTKDCGLDGVVASPQEAASIRAACGKDFLIVTPGVRPSWASADDQMRATTPAEAIENGADYIVVGRPITRHKNPAEAADRIVEEVASKL